MESLFQSNRVESNKIIVLQKFTAFADEKEAMKKLVSAICKHTIELSALASQVPHTELSSLDDLQQLLERWGHSVEALEDLCDTQLYVYLEPCRQLRTSLQLENIHLLNTAVSVADFLPVYS